MAVTNIPNVTNWSVTPQNGQAGYFLFMNTWLSESTAVIASLRKAINAQNTANSEINALAIQVAGNAIDARNARNEALTAVATLQGGAIDNTTIAPNKAFSNQYTNNNFVKLTGNETIAGIKTFSSSPIVPTPTTNTQAANKAYVDTKQANLGFVPVQQGGGAGQFTNKIYIGWGGSYLRCQVDTTDFGTTFPINVAGSATYAAAFITAVGSAPSYACRAWVNFNGTGTVAIRASGNVSSITDNGVGDYTVNFSVAMPDANYNIIGTAREDSIGNTANFVLGTAGTTLPLAGSFKVLISNNITSGSSDSTIICASVFR